MTVRWVGLSAIFVYSPNSGDFLKRREARREWEEALREAVAAGTPPPSSAVHSFVRVFVCLFARSIGWASPWYACCVHVLCFQSQTLIGWRVAQKRRA